MITIKDIQAAVAKQLTNNKFSVTASEVKEGFTKPTCFIEVLPVSVTLQNQYSELVTVSVEIAYHPIKETKEEILTAAELFKDIFIYSPLPVKDRFLGTDEIVFDYDKSVLYANFDIEYMQETKVIDAPMPKMKTLHERMVTEGHGTSKDSD